MIEREEIRKRIETALQRSRVVLLSGPRQCGKTTLAKQFVDTASVNYFDLEDPTSLIRLEEPMTALRPLRGTVVIDEVQRRPELFPVLRVLADRDDSPARFLILGSASGDLLRQSSESLAGRVEKIVIGGLLLGEVGANQSQELWSRGGFPLSYLAPQFEESLTWREQFVSTLLERDLPQWGVQVPAVALHRFWTMIAHYHGQTWNAAEPANALGVNQSTVRRYLDLLTDAYMVRQLSPWHENLKKRQVKSVKIYIRDSGILHSLLLLRSEKEVLIHPKVGASWEGFVIEQILGIARGSDPYFWSTHQGAEIDLLLVRGNRMLGIECKRTDAPRVTKSMKIGLKDLKLDQLLVIYPGEKRYPMDEQIEAVPLSSLATEEFEEELNSW